MTIMSIFSYTGVSVKISSLSTISSWANNFSSLMILPSVFRDEVKSILYCVLKRKDCL